MRKIVLVFALIGFFSCHQGKKVDAASVSTKIEKQEKQSQPIVWRTKAHQISATEYNIEFSVSLGDGWKLYSQNNPEGGSQALKIGKSTDGKGFELVGKAVESKTYTEYSDVWGQEELFFKGSGVLTQKIVLLESNVTQVNLNVFGQICKKACVQIDQDFKISLK